MTIKASNGLATGARVGALLSLTDSPVLPLEQDAPEHFEGVLSRGKKGNEPRFPQANTRSRRMKDRSLYALMAAATAIILFFLAWIIIYILSNGLAALNWDFLTKPAQEGGIFPMIVTTVYLVIAAMLVSLPLGIMSAIYLVEFRPRKKVAQVLGLAIETLAGIPSIIYGLFGLLVFVRMMGLGQSIIAGAFTLSIMILPVIIRTTEESLKATPISYRQASLALGATRWQTIRKVVIPSALPGIFTATILAIGRVVGEAAPVLLTVGISRNIPENIFSSGRTLSIHLYYLTKEAVHPGDFEIAFATAAVLLILVLLINGIARLLSRQLGKT